MMTNEVDNDRTDDPIAAATALADTLTRENEALRRQDLSEAVGLLDRKRRETDALAAAQAGLRRGPRLRPDRRALAQAVAARLEGIAAENKRLLEQAIAVQAQVIGLLLRAVPAAAARPAYGAGGGRATRLQPMSLSARI